MASDTEQRLGDEIAKWASRMEKELADVEACGTKGMEFLGNIRAYASDSSHFRDKGDLVRSFEAIIWAWAWMEIGKDLGFLRNEYVTIGRR